MLSYRLYSSFTSFYTNILFLFNLGHSIFHFVILPPLSPWICDGFPTFPQICIFNPGVQKHVVGMGRGERECELGDLPLSEETLCFLFQVMLLLVRDPAGNRRHTLQDSEEN